VLLFPLGIGLDLLAERFGLIVYALLFGLAAAGRHRRGRRRPPAAAAGPRVVPPRAMAGDAPETPAERQFLHVSLLNSLGMGLTPFWSVYAMSMLGLSAGFALTMSAVSQVAMVWRRRGRRPADAWLVGADAARSIGIRIMAVVLPILALPGSMLAPLLMYVSAALASIGFALGQLATNERLFRLVRGPDGDPPVRPAAVPQLGGDDRPARWRRASCWPSARRLATPRSPRCSAPRRWSG
jgi:hypothetical protein